MRKVLVLILILAVGISLYGMVNFASTQLHPASEREFIVSKLAEFTKETGIKVNFLALSYTEILSRVEAEQKTGKISIGLVADLQGGLYLLASKGFLQDLSDVEFYLCPFCGYIEIGKPTDPCPICGAKPEKFIQI